MTTETPWESDARHQRNTFLVLMAHAATLGGWETWTIVSPHFGDTLSATIRALGEGQSLIPFAFGLLNGHLWFSNRWAFFAMLCGIAAGAVFWKLTDAARKEKA